MGKKQAGAGATVAHPASNDSFDSTTNPTGSAASNINEPALIAVPATNDQQSSAAVASAPATEPKTRPLRPPTGQLSDTATSYGLAAWTLARLVGVLYLISFLSLWIEAQGLMGSEGVSPLPAFMNRIRTGLYSESTPIHYPTLFWLVETDRAIDFLSALGIVCSVALTLDILPALAALLSWLLFLSLTVGGQSFTAFQADSLLLETGFLTILLCPLHGSVWPLNRNPFASRPPPAVVWTLRLLLWRLHASRGLLQLLGKDRSWRHLAAFHFHFETQPSPTALAWYANWLPIWFKQGLVFWELTVELALALFVFGPRMFRRVSFFYLAALHLFYIGTGNFGTFHWNILVLCLLLLDDALFPRLTRHLRRLAAQPHAPAAAADTPQQPQQQAQQQPQQPQQPQQLQPVAVTESTVELWRQHFAAAAALVLVLLSAVALAAVMHGALIAPAPLLSLYRAAYPYRICNLYGLDYQVAPHRYELVVQGSMDAHNWHDYLHRYKPDAELDRYPIFASPFESRFERRMAEAAYSDYHSEVWLSRLLHRLLEDSEPVVALFRAVPFEQPPEYVRVARYEYRWVEPSTNGTGWWTRSLHDIFTPSFSQSAHTMSSRRKAARRHRPRAK